MNSAQCMEAHGKWGYYCIVEAEKLQNRRRTFRTKSKRMGTYKSTYDRLIDTSRLSTTYSTEYEYYYYLFKCAQ